MRREVAGRASSRVAGSARAFVRVGPTTRRRIRTGPDGARILVIGGVPGEAYEPSENLPLGGPETVPCPTASSSLIPRAPAHNSLRLVSLRGLADDVAGPDGAAGDDEGVDAAQVEVEVFLGVDEAMRVVPEAVEELAAAHVRLVADLDHG